MFDNIPLTKLALEQGGYDWGMLAYAVGFGGSMIWFGSSAGVRSPTCFPRRARSGLAQGRLARTLGVRAGIPGAAARARLATRTDRRSESLIRNVVFDIGGVLVRLRYQPFIDYLA